MGSLGIRFFLLFFLGVPYVENTDLVYLTENIPANINN